MKVYGEMEAEDHAFLIPSLYGNELSSSHPNQFFHWEISPDAHCIGGVEKSH